MRSSDPIRASLRDAHGVRLIDVADEGRAITSLPPGVYGYSYTPALAAPLFRTRTRRGFEMHRRRDGEAVVIGFVGAADAERLLSAPAPVEITLMADAASDAEAIVSIACARIVNHRQYTVREEEGIRLVVAPAHAAST